MSRAALGLCAGLAVALAIACGAAPMQSAPAPVHAVEGRPDNLHAQIEALDKDIGDREGGAQLAPVGGAEVSAAGAITMDAAAQVCTPPAHPSDTCGDACKLGDAICDDAGRICALADQLPGDAWAAGKCASGKASCERARQRCCDCN